MNIAIDFDETIQNNNAAPQGYKMGPPMPGAVAVINKLHEDGNKIIIFTARDVQKPNVKQAVADWLAYFKIPFHEITNVKKSEFDVYIDNRAMHFQSWSQIFSDLAKVTQNVEVWGQWSNHVPEHGGSAHLMKDITLPLDDPTNIL